MNQQLYTYRLWVRINDFQTTETLVFASDDYHAKLLGESQFGAGNVLSYTRTNHGLLTESN